MGKYVKLRVGLENHITVIRLADELGLHHDHAIGALYAVAGWFSVHSKYGFVDADAHCIDVISKVKGMGEFLLSVKWLEQVETPSGKSLRMRYFASVCQDRKAISARLRKEMLEGACCVVCLATQDLVIDHIIPVSRGGSSDATNLQVLCWDCNAAKGHKTMEDFLRDS